MIEGRYHAYIVQAPPKSKATPRVKRVAKASAPSTQPFLRFYHSKSLRTKTLAVLATLEKAKDSTQHRDALADVIGELIDSGMEYYFLRPLKLAKAGFFTEQQPISAWRRQHGYWHPSSATSSAAWMALNFFSCAIMFGSSWSELAS